MRGVRIVESGTSGPRLLLLPGLGARGTGFRALAAALATRARTVIVDYPEGRRAATGAAELAEAVRADTGPVDGIIASSFGGLVAAHFGKAGATRGIAFIGSFTALAQLELRGRLFALMGPIATLGRPGAGAAMIAANALVRPEDVAEIVPTTRLERAAVWHRALAVAREPAPPRVSSGLSCLAIQGGRDWLVPAWVLPRLAQALPPGTPMHVIPDAGHVPYFTHPADCARLLSPWIAGLREASGVESERPRTGASLLPG